MLDQRPSPATADSLLTFAHVPYKEWTKIMLAKTWSTTSFQNTCINVDKKKRKLWNKNLSSHKHTHMYINTYKRNKVTCGRFFLYFFCRFNEFSLWCQKKKKGMKKKIYKKKSLPWPGLNKLGYISLPLHTAPHYTLVFVLKKIVFRKKKNEGKKIQKQYATDAKKNRPHFTWTSNKKTHLVFFFT